MDAATSVCECSLRFHCRWLVGSGFVAFPEMLSMFLLFLLLFFFLLLLLLLFLLFLFAVLIVVR